MSVGGIAATAIGVVGCCRDPDRLRISAPLRSAASPLRARSLCFFLLNQFPEQVGKRAKERCKAVVFRVRLLEPCLIACWKTVVSRSKG